MVSALDMIGAFKKDYGDAVGGYGAKLKDTERIPTGCFEFDLASGGGFPRGYTSVVYGNPSAGKTNLAAKAVANHQILWPDKSCVWMAVEDFDPEWTGKLGVDVDKLIVMKPDFAEHVADMIEGFLGADDCGLIVVDSVAAMIGSAAAKKSAEDAVMGGIGTIMSRLCDKITLEIRKAEKEGRVLPTVILVNQLRMKVGVVFGNPMVLPGGAKQTFLSALTTRVTGKNIMDAKFSQVLPVRKETQFVIEKHKVPIFATNGKFEMAMVPHKGLAIGECEDWPTISNLMKANGKLVKHDKGGWAFDGKLYPTLTACREQLMSDPVYGLKVRKNLIQAAMVSGAFVPTNNEE